MMAVNGHGKELFESSSRSRSERPRVLFVSFNLAPKLGGLEQVVAETRAALSERAEVLTLAQGARGYDDADPTIMRPSVEGLVAYMGFLYTRGLLGLGDRGFDLVVAGSALTALPTVHLARRFGARSACIIYGLDTIHASSLYQRVYRHAMPQMDKVIAISTATRDEAVTRGVEPERTVIIPPGCDADLFQTPRDTAELRRRWGLEDRKVILSPGRLVRRKGVDRFIRECMPEVVRQVPAVKLVVAGGNPEGALAHTDDVLARVEGAIRESGLEDHVVVTGRLSSDEMVAAFQLADVVVLPVIPVPGDMEGFGIVLLEAGAAGIPVVATAIGGITDAVIEGETGILVPPLGYAAMASGLIGFLQDDAKSQAFGERGRLRALREFNWNVISSRYAEALLTA
jgi:phosphatidylinositol alpha-1,6-mannosyltransferase